MFLKSYMLAGAGEKMQYLAHEFNDNTIRFVLRYPGRVRGDVLMRAVGTVVERIDVLHASFIARHTTALWHVNREITPGDYFTCVEAQDSADVAVQAALTGISPDAKAQLHCTLVQGENESILALCISHLCVDGGDGKYLPEKICEAYNLLLQEGNAAALQIKNGSRAAEQMYAHLNSKEVRSLLKNPMTGVKTLYPFRDDAQGERRLVGCMIERSEMERIRHRAREKGASFNDALLAACYQVISRMEGMDPSSPVSVMSMVDLRRYCPQGESEGLCNMAGSMPTALREGVPDCFEDTLQLVCAQTKRFKEEPLAGMEGLPLLHGAARALPLSLLLRIAGRVYAHMSVGVTNLGNIRCNPLRLGEYVPDEGMFGGPLKKKPNVQLSVASFDGKCALCVLGEYTQSDAAQLQETLEKIKETLLTFARE